jgi:DNA repair exonuclease SbcCD ATPase subunit
MKNAINENKKKITFVEKKINDENEKLEKKIENLNEELKIKENDILKELNIKENEMNLTIKNTNNKINIIEKIIYDEIKISINNLEQKINEMKGYNNELKKDLNENKLAIENNNKLFNEQFININQKIKQNISESLFKDKDNLDKKLIQLENNFNNFELKIKNLEVEKDKVMKSEKINGLEDKLNNIEIKLNKDLDKAYEKINNLMNELNKKNDNMVIIFDKYEVLNNKINKFENSFNLIDEKSIKAIENENNIIKRIDDLENEIKNNSSQSNEMKIKIDSLINSKQELEIFIKEMNNNIKKIEHKNKSLIKKKINNKQNSSSSVGKLHKNKINLIGDILINNYNKDEEFHSDKNNINQEKINANKEINNDLIGNQRKEINNYESENSEVKYNTINSYGGVNFPFSSLENTINESKIIQYSDIIFIEKRIKEIHPKIKNVLFNLVYRVTDDGDKSTDFHKRCDKIGPNITFVKTKKGYIFGGFTFKNWEHLQRDINIDKPNLGSASRDSRAFGFSINLKKIYNNEKPNEFAIWCNRNYGPTFKNNFFQIFDDCLQKGGYCSIKNNSHFSGQNYDYEISGGESRFGVEELEVYEVQLQ